MKKRYISLILALVLLVPIAVRAAQSTNSNLSATVSIPVTTGLTGTNNSAKSFILDLPSGVSPSAITTSSMKYSGDNTLVSLAVENGKIKVTLKGVELEEKIEVDGYWGAHGNLFQTNIGNSIWRYSDGRRWQINEYDVNKKKLHFYDLPAADSATPSEDPPKRAVSALSNQSTTGLKWYKSKEELIDAQYVVASTITVNPAGGSDYLKDTSFKDGKIVTTYNIGPKAKGVNSTWEKEEAGKPITGDAQGRFYSAFVNYSYKATAKMTSYRYSGKVTFDYTLSDDPTLDASVGVVTPNPNPTQFVSGTDIPVKLDLQGVLGSYTNTTNIDEWVFYAKKTGVDSSLQTKKSALKVVSNSTTFNFTIDDAEVRADPFSQGYTLTATVRFKSPVTLTDGTTITSISDTVTTSVGVYKSLPPSSEPHPTSDPIATGQPPIAKLTAPSSVRAGDEVLVSGVGSRDPDGTITDYSWGTTGSSLEIGNVDRGKVLYGVDQIGESYPVHLTVVDNDGLTGDAEKTITVTAPAPKASFTVSGSLKENRKVTLTNTSDAPTHYPLLPGKTVLTITAVSGGTNAEIAYQGDLSNFTETDVLFRKAGTYKVSLSVTNTYGLTATKEQVLTIKADESPFAYFTMPQKVYRDPDNGNKAVVSIDDMSFSTDNDTIAQRVWMYRYDSDNDGSFEDENWVTYNNANESRLNMSFSEVGKYEIKVIVYEEFGQPTIDELVSQSDRRWTDGSTTQALIERTVEVDNRAPEVDWGS